MGFDVALPVTESAAYDIIVDAPEGLKRVQVKFSGSGVEVGLRNIHWNRRRYVERKTEEGAYDWLYILTGDGREFLIKKCLVGRRCVTPQESDRIWSVG